VRLLRLFQGPRAPRSCARPPTTWTGGDRRRAREAWQRGATEVCLQGGIHPRYTGQTYLDICRAIKAAQPGMHIHAFSPLEVWQGAQPRWAVPVETCCRLQGGRPGLAAGHRGGDPRRRGARGDLPGQAEHAQWLEVVAHRARVGLTTTATIMFGHVEGRGTGRGTCCACAPAAGTGGFTELVPLPFVHMEAPIYREGPRAARGPTFREALLMHAVARLVLHPHFRNIQTSWVKMGRGCAACLQAGANDLGGTLMNESISRAAGASRDTVLKVLQNRSARKSGHGVQVMFDVTDLLQREHTMTKGQNRAEIDRCESAAGAGPRVITAARSSPGWERWSSWCRRIVRAGSRRTCLSAISAARRHWSGPWRRCMQGVSTRKVKAITQDLCGHVFSASAIINKTLDTRASRPAPSGACRRTSREAGVIVSQAVLVAVG
jgi:hypothetical protein